MKTIENNKLIAEFYGLDEHFLISENVGQEIREFNGDELRFDTSWDWLMPVVEKIEQVNEGVPSQLMYVSLFSEHSEVYSAVVEFIKLYNENKED
jgi:hypothetical protein